MRYASRYQGAKCGKQIVRSVDVDVQRGEFVIERIAYKALRRQVVTLVRFHLIYDTMDTRIAFQGSGVKIDPVTNSNQPRKPVLRVLKRHSPDYPVDFIPFGQEQFG
jgi:hypothetical protein